MHVHSHSVIYTRYQFALMTFTPCDINLPGCDLFDLFGDPNEGKFRYARYNTEFGELEWHREVMDYSGVGGAIAMRDSGA